MLAHGCSQFLTRSAAQLLDMTDAQPLQHLFCLPAHAPDTPDRQRIEYRPHILGCHDDKPVRFPEIRSQLGEELVRRQPDRSHESRFLTDLSLELPGISERRPHEMFHARQIKESFIDGKRLHHRRIAGKNRKNLPGYGTIAFKTPG